MSLPKFLQAYLPSYDISKMELSDQEDAKEIITQILNYGDKKEDLWLFRTFNLEQIKAVLRHPNRGCWREEALNYWTKIFEIKLPKIIYEVAIFSLNPRPELMKKYFRYIENKK